MPARIPLALTLVTALWLPGAFAGQGSGPSPPAKTHTNLAPGMRVDINHASIEDLMKTPGMTRTWAARIMRFRPYRTKQDLLDRGVLPSNVYDRIKDAVIAHRDR